MQSKVQLVVFDWAGTTTDFGSSAPVRMFDKTFSEYGLNFGRKEINAPMGLEKKEHIRSMLSTDRGQQLWRDIKGRKWNENDIEYLYNSFEENLRASVGKYSRVISGVPEAVKEIRNMGIKIGSTTGYTAEIMSYVLPVAKADGYEPDCVVTPDSVGFGRPTPFMIYECMRKTGVWPSKNVVKVGDTAVDIQEGKNAGAWTVGILKGSSVMGLFEEEYDTETQEDLLYRSAAARQIYTNAGADYIIDSISDLPNVIEEISQKLASSEAE